MRQRTHIGVCLAAATLLAVPAIAEQTDPIEELKLQVLLVNDRDFPAVTKEDATAILREANATLADKLGFRDLRFEIVGSKSARQFLTSHAPRACLEQFAEYRVAPNGLSASDVPRAAMNDFLSRWEVDELRSFFPEQQREKLETHEAIAGALTVELDRKIELINSFVLESGESLLASSKLEQRSYVRWICAIRDQDEADLILTNSFILYDLGSEPYPHSVFAKNKVGGASLLSPKRKAIRGRAVVASTFSMDTKLPFFREDGIETLTVEEKLEVIGTFIVAHELGHALFKLPDFYDHPKECLMTTKYETGYVSGYRELKRFVGACSACQPHVDARRHVFAARAAQAAGDYQRSIEELKGAIRLTPKHVDGSYLRYIADLSSDVAGAYAELGDQKQARRWLKATLRIVPEHSGALELKQKLDATD